MLEGGLDGGVQGKEEQSDGQRVRVCFVASEEEGESVAYNRRGGKACLGKEVLGGVSRFVKGVGSVTNLKDWLA
jgi:hypothetical protein